MGAGSGVLGQPDVADGREVGRFEAGADGERVVGADREDPGQPHDGALLDAAHGVSDGDPGEVEVVRGKGVEAAAAGVLGLELQAHAGVLAAEGDDGLGHEVAHGGGAGGDAHRTATAPHQGVEPAQGPVESADAVGGGGLKDPPCLGGYDAPRVALQERGPGLLLQTADVLTDGGLRTSEVAGNGTETAGPADGDEDSEIIEGHHTQGIPWVSCTVRGTGFGQPCARP